MCVQLSADRFSRMVCVHAVTRLMDTVSHVDTEEANVDWMEMASDSDSDSHDSN